MVDVFSGRLLVSKDGRSVDPEEALQNKVVGLYFSAGWCSPCRDFTPVLCDFYTELLEETQPPAPFEVVFISSDHSAEEMAGYMHAMHGDWLALPFHDPYKHWSWDSELVLEFLETLEAPPFEQHSQQLTLTLSDVH
ncbi:nucleoredoxin-like protein 2 isoform X2 [Calonectris borealis]|uniref:nucleoredoxin-like protein 2 isoform X2 n=1 Tax=Calonectris borealis TaxID=1323832 RepID=UPI003F4B0846